MDHGNVSAITSGGTADYPEAWVTARRLVKVLGKFPATFTTPIRTLIHDDKRGEALSPAALFLTTRLLRSPTVKAMFYYISLSYFGDKLSNSAYLSSSDLIRLYRPRDAAAILVSIYVSRRLSSVKVESLPGWKELQKIMTQRTEVGGHVGIAIPELGIAKGIFSGALPELSMAIMGLGNPEAYASYMEYLSQTGHRYSIDFEMEYWNCRHLDVAGNLLQQMGFGIEQAHAFILGHEPGGNPLPDNNPHGFEYSLVNLWIESLMENRTEPGQKHLGRYYPREKEMYRLLYEINHLYDSGSRHNWLTRTKEDINPQTTPQLFQEFLLELEDNAAIQSFYKENLPEEVLESLSEADLDALSKAKGTGLE